MNCLTDYIGLSGCGASSPASGLFINSLPGISLKSVEQLADAEQKTYIGVWNDVQLRATKRLEMMLNAELSKQHKVKTGLVTFLTKADEQFTNHESVQYVAFKIEADCESYLLSHYIQSIKVRKFESSDDIQCTIVDQYNNILYSNIFTSNGLDTQTIEIGESFYEKIIYVVLDVTGTEWYTDTFSSTYIGCVQIQGGTSNNIGANFVETSKSYGVTINYGLRCSLSNLMCYAKDLFAMPLWYLLGSEMMMERMTSERINKWTVDRKQAEELKAYYDTEAEKALGQAIAGTSINDCNCCIQCDPVIAVREARL